jgi:hypothetical protein
VSRPALVIELDLLRREMQEAASAGRADAAAAAAALSSSVEQVRGVAGRMMCTAGAARDTRVCLCVRLLPMPCIGMCVNMLLLLAAGQP